VLMSRTRPSSRPHCQRLDIPPASRPPSRPARRRPSPASRSSPVCPFVQRPLCGPGPPPPGPHIAQSRPLRRRPRRYRRYAERMRGDRRRARPVQNRSAALMSSRRSYAGEQRTRVDTANPPGSQESQRDERCNPGAGTARPRRTRAPVRTVACPRCCQDDRLDHAGAELAGPCQPRAYSAPPMPCLR
jgi:hypothetical protein